MFLTDYFEIHQVHPSRFLSELKFLYFYFLISDSGSGPGARASFYFIFDFFLLFFCVCVSAFIHSSAGRVVVVVFAIFFFLPCLPSSFSSADFDKFATGPRRQWRRRSTTTDVIDDRRLRRTSTSSSSSPSSSFSLSGNAASPIIFERKRMSFSALPVSWVGIFFFFKLKL